jgi:hypothetical protein
MTSDDRRPQIEGVAMTRARILNLTGIITSYDNLGGAFISSH